MKFNKTYFFLFLIILTIEITIAVFLKTGFIRHTFGDFLVVILLYSFVKSFWNCKPLTIALLVLSVSFLVEFLQLTPFLSFLKLENNKLAKIILGNTFHVSDLVAYTLGVMAVILIEYKIKPLWKI